MLMLQGRRCKIPSSAYPSPELVEPAEKEDGRQTLAPTIDGGQRRRTLRPPVPTTVMI